MRNFIEHFTINIFKQGFGFLIVLNNCHYKIKLGLTRFDFVFPRYRCATRLRSGTGCLICDGGQESLRRYQEKFLSTKVNYFVLLSLSNKL